jgi:hypothetical protein
MTEVTVAAENNMFCRRRRRNKPFLYELLYGLDYTPTPIQLTGCLPIQVQLAQKIHCHCQLPCSFPTQNRCQLVAILPQFAITVGSVATQNRTDCQLLPSALGSPANWQNGLFSFCFPITEKLAQGAEYATLLCKEGCEMIVTVAHLQHTHLLYIGHTLGKLR